MTTRGSVFGRRHGVNFRPSLTAGGRAVDPGLYASITGLQRTRRSRRRGSRSRGPPTVPLVAAQRPATQAATPVATWSSAAPLAPSTFAVSPPATSDERLLTRHPDHRRDRSMAPRRSAGQALGLPAHRTPLQQEPERRDHDDDGGHGGEQHQPQAATTAHASRATRMRRRPGQGTPCTPPPGTQRFHGRHSPGTELGLPNRWPSRCAAGRTSPDGLLRWGCSTLAAPGDGPGCPSSPSACRSEGDGDRDRHERTETHRVDPSQPDPAGRPAVSPRRSACEVEQVVRQGRRAQCCGADRLRRQGRGPGPAAPAGQATNTPPPRKRASCTTPGPRVNARPSKRGVSLWVRSSRSGLVDGAVAEHRVEDVGAAASQADEGGVVAFACGAFAVVVGPGVGSARAAKAERNSARSRCLLPPRGGRSPRMEVPERRMTGARPA